MNMFVIWVSSFVKEECCTITLHHHMDISRLIVYAQKIKESKLRKINKDGKRAKSDEQGKPKSKKRFYNKISSIWSKDRVAN